MKRLETRFTLVRLAPWPRAVHQMTGKRLVQISRYVLRTHTASSKLLRE